MNRKNFQLLNYSFIVLFLTSIILLLFISGQVNALEPDKDTPKVNIGAGGSFEYCNVNHTGSNDMNWEPGYGYGGGLVLESMFSKTFGLHSGLWFSHFIMKANIPDKDTGEKIKTTMKTNMFIMPLYLITSFDSRYITFNLLTGLNLSYIAESYMKPSPDGDGSENSENIKKYLGYGQIGAGAGIEFLFKISKFTRLFISCVGEYYFTNLITENEGSVDNLYGVNLRAGIMLSTF